MIEANDFKRNMMIEVDGKPYQIIDINLSTPTARGGNTIIRTRLRCLLDGSTTDKPFRSSDRLPEPDVEKTKCQYLYSDDRFAHFMDVANYEQCQLGLPELGDTTLYLFDGMPELQVMFYNGNPVDVILPLNVEMEITETEPSMKGVTASAQTKAATLASGLVVQVPAYISIGEVVKVDTRTGSYLGRVSK
jgi:elongation factor P